MMSFYHGLWKRYGDLVRIPLGPMSQYLVTRPDHIRHVLFHNWRNYCKGVGWRNVRRVLGDGLLTSEGKLWQQQRRLANPVFQPQACRELAGVIGSAVNAVLARWRGLEERQKVIDVLAEMTRLTAMVSAWGLFGVDGEEKVAEISQACAEATEFVIHSQHWFVNLPVWIPTPLNRRFKRTMDTINALVDDLIARRRQRPEGEGNFLDLLIKDRDKDRGAGPGNGQVRDEVMTALFAGHETTPLALSWTWYLLAQYPDMEGRLHDELECVLAGRPPGPPDLLRLPFALRLLQESMRLCPPVPLFVRDALADDELGDYRIPAGAMIAICPYLAHRHPDYWEDPECFDPDRFLPERSADRAGLAYLPFGGGPRVCIGQHLALLQMHLALAALAQSYRLRLVPGPPIGVRGAGILLPGRPIRATLQRRR
jgi:cytochrome P450